ncbi:hypothetical protein V7S43_006176 [Phytophthora oleae]|uniref:Uncharacterized protein n=1 Tax=Phytophthora oleae TaxID=2107226 RepID=A0ABD3FSI2_9STRA
MPYQEVASLQPRPVVDQMLHRVPPRQTKPQHPEQRDSTPVANKVKASGACCVLDTPRISPTTMAWPSPGSSTMKIVSLLHTMCVVDNAWSSDSTYSPRHPETGRSAEAARKVRRSPVRPSLHPSRVLGSPC